MFPPLHHMPGSPRDGQVNERVLVRQPVCPTHSSAGQENRLAALCHQGNPNLSLSFLKEVHSAKMKLRGGLRMRLGVRWRPLPDNSAGCFWCQVLSRDFLFLQLLWTWTFYKTIKGKTFER